MGLGKMADGNGIGNVGSMLPATLGGGVAQGGIGRLFVGSLAGSANVGGGVEHRPFLCGSSGGGNGFGRTVCGGGTANGVVARADVFAVYGVARVHRVWRIAALSAVDGFAVAADGDLRAVGVSVCGQRRIGRMGRFAQRLRGGGAHHGRKWFSDGLLCNRAFIETSLTARSDFGFGNVYRRICSHIIPVTPRMADADHFDLRLSRARRCGQLRTGDGVDGSIDRFGFNGIFAGGRSGRTKGRLNVVGSNPLRFHYTIAAPCIEN